jgi:hypothetical protein
MFTLLSIIELVLYFINFFDNYIRTYRYRKANKCSDIFEKQDAIPYLNFIPNRPHALRAANLNGCYIYTLPSVLQICS